MNRIANFLTLFTSMSTLVCCALPALLVSLGLGAVMAGLASNVPGLIWISEHKGGVFALAGATLLVNGIWLWSQRNAPCPVNPKLREACLSGRKMSRITYFVSVAMFSTGAFFAFFTSIAPIFGSSVQVIKVEVTKDGFIPNSIAVKPGTEVVLEVTRKTDETCAKDIQVPAKGIKKTSLPLGKPVSITLGLLEAGEIKFGCSMGMMESGHIIIR